MNRDDYPAVNLTLRERVEFLKMLDVETNLLGRRLISMWATPDDVSPRRDYILSESLKLLWKTVP